MFEQFRKKVKENIKAKAMRSQLFVALLHVAMAAMTGDRVHANNVMQIESTKITKNAFLAIVIMSVMSLVVGSVFLYIGIFVNAVVYSAIPTAGLDANDTTTLAGIKTNVNTAFTLGGIIMIVIGASGIIAVLLGMVPGGARRA